MRRFTLHSLVACAAILVVGCGGSLGSDPDRIAIEQILREHAPQQAAAEMAKLDASFAKQSDVGRPNFWKSRRLGYEQMYAKAIKSKKAQADQAAKAKANGSLKGSEIIAILDAGKDFSKVPARFSADGKEAGTVSLLIAAPKPGYPDPTVTIKLDKKLASAQDAGMMLGLGNLVMKPLPDMTDYSFGKAGKWYVHVPPELNEIWIGTSQYPK